jgi:uncharacterized membrane protein YkoI
MIRLLLLVLVSMVPLIGRAAADEDHERARHAREAGRVLPLQQILASARDAFGGEVLDVELEDGDEGGALVYEIKLLAAGGRVVKLEYDAVSGELLGTRRSGSDGRRR